MYLEQLDVIVIVGVGSVDPMESRHSVGNYGAFGVFGAVKIGSGGVRSRFVGEKEKSCMVGGD